MSISCDRPLLPACCQVQCPFPEADVFVEAPTMDSDLGTAGHLPQRVLGQTGVGAVVLRQGILDVERSHASLTGGVSILDGLPCGGKHRKAQPVGTGGGDLSPALSRAAAVVTLMLTIVAQIHGELMKCPAPNTWAEACRERKRQVPGR